MKIETIKCVGYNQQNDTLTITLVETDIHTIENVLGGKRELSVYTDNMETPQLVEKLQGGSIISVLKLSEREFDVRILTGESSLDDKNSKIRQLRQAAYQSETDSLLMAANAYTLLGEDDKAQSMKAEWQAKRAEIDERYPYITEP